MAPFAKCACADAPTTCTSALSHCLQAVTHRQCYHSSPALFLEFARLITNGRLALIVRLGHDDMPAAHCTAVKTAASRKEEKELVRRARHSSHSIWLYEYHYSLIAGTGIDSR